ncbi:MAG: NAD(P)-dependent oxidoreductase [Patescibacteria group bacterium]
MKKVLITGGAGYIGNVLVESLLDDGFEVTVLDSLLYKQPCLIEHCYRKDFKFVYGDVRDHKLFKELIGKADVIVHLAAYVGMSACKKFPSEAIQVNYESAKFLAENIRKDQLVIYPTTNSGYGLGVHKGGKAVFCTEETPLKPISLYGETKADAEKVLLDTGRAISLRLATVFGFSKRMRMDLLVNDFVWRAFNDRFVVLFESHFLRNFIHIRDIAKTMKFCIKNHKKMVGEVYNVGNTSINMSKMDLCKAIKKQVPDFCIMESEINKDPDQRNYIVSNEKLEKLGWSCDYSLDDGIRELLHGFPIIKNSNTTFTNQ